MTFTILSLRQQQCNDVTIKSDSFQKQECQNSIAEGNLAVGTSRSSSFAATGGDDEERGLFFTRLGARRGFGVVSVVQLSKEDGNTPSRSDASQSHRKAGREIPVPVDLREFLS